MEFHKVVLFSDLDGTLFNDESEVSDINRSAIMDFCRQGGIFCISSGRMPQNAESYLSGVTINGPCILFNGSAVYDWENKTFFFIKHLNMERAQQLAAWVLEQYPEIDVQVYPGTEICFVSPEESSNREFVACHQPCRFTTLDKVEKPWLKILMQGNPNVLKKIRDYGEQIHIKEFVRTSIDYLELLPEGVNKGTALNQVRQLPELAGRTVVAIGDFYNDLELLMNADIGVAPENALPEVKQVADYVVCDNNHGAVAECIHRIIPMV